MIKKSEIREGLKCYPYLLKLNILFNKSGVSDKMGPYILWET